MCPHKHIEPWIIESSFGKHLVLHQIHRDFFSTSSPPLQGNLEAFPPSPNYPAITHPAPCECGRRSKCALASQEVEAAGSVVGRKVLAAALPGRLPLPPRLLSSGDSPPILNHHVIGLNLPRSYQDPSSKNRQTSKLIKIPALFPNHKLESLDSALGPLKLSRGPAWNPKQFFNGCLMFGKPITL